MTEEERLNMLIDACQESDFSLDVLELITRGLDNHAVRISCGNVSARPRNKKSSDVPYTAFTFKAP
ncbi:MAG: hypothetical protein OIF58_11210 [Cohaesibacter sp.]|nr:hypothetical protein [Cohaesibacter sp.]